MRVNRIAIVVTGLAAFMLSGLWYSPLLFGGIWREFANADTALPLWLWLAFYAVQLTGAVIFDRMPWQLGAVHDGDWLMKMAFMAMVLSLWHRRRILGAAAEPRAVPA